MEKDFGSWFQHQLSDWQSPNLKTLVPPPFNVGQQNNIPARMSPCANVVSTNGNLPGLAFSEVPHFNASQQPNGPHGWFFLPRFRQAFNPVPNFIFKEKISDDPCKNHEVVTPNPAPGRAQKRFIVFDQSEDQTTLMFSSGIGTPVQCPASFGPKLNSAYDLNKIVLGNERGTVSYRQPVLPDEYNVNHGNDTGSEMHEDTEELNALLYSDDEDEDEDEDSEDDEVASTGHSPGTMTADYKQEWPEEVASSTGLTKRRKLVNGGYEVPSPMMDTASSAKSKRCSDYDDDAESSCAEGKYQGLGEFESNKRSRKDKIRETVGILQSIIPGGKGKDAIVILDEAISYLRALKHKAKALGVDTF